LKSIGIIREQLSSGNIKLTDHALERIVERNISKLEIQQAGKRAVIIENYPEDKYSPSCLLLGFTYAKRPLHIQVSRLDSEYIKIITLYEPTENEWLNYAQRR
jgi:hypothetical protein